MVVHRMRIWCCRSQGPGLPHPEETDGDGEGVDGKREDVDPQVTYRAVAHLAAPLGGSLEGDLAAAARRGE